MARIRPEAHRVRRERSSRPCLTGDIFAAPQAGYGSPGQLPWASSQASRQYERTRLICSRILLFHAAQKLHPLKRCDVGIGAFTEHREDVTLQGADDSPAVPASQLVRRRRTTFRQWLECLAGDIPAFLRACLVTIGFLPSAASVRNSAAFCLATSIRSLRDNRQAQAMTICRPASW